MNPELFTIHDLTPTFNKDIAPIVFARCAPCHRPDGVGPFSLLTYADAKRRAQKIADVTARRIMPPWPPEPGHGEFVGERRLSEREIATIQRWIASGAPEGRSTDLPPKPAWPGGWQLGEPDLVVSLPQPYAVQADGPDVFRKLVMPISFSKGGAPPPPGSGTRYVRGIEFRPGNARVLHHAIMHLDPTGQARRLDRQDPEPGIGGMLFSEGVSPEGHFLGWSPGRMPTLGPADMAWRLDEGTDLILQLHLMPTGKPETIQPAIGFFFASRPPSRVGLGLQLGSYTIDIPPGATDYVVEDRYVLPVDVEVHSIYPHAHYLGKDVQAYVMLPDGTKRWLIWIKNWDFYWQGDYQYVSPVVLPKGATIVMRYAYDNSPANRRNPSSPPRRVVYGGQSSDEMANLWMQVVPRAASDLARLREDYARKAATRYVDGYLKMLAGDRENPAIHRGLGFAYLRAGRIDEAIGHLREALRLGADASDAALVYYNLGNAEAARGRARDAIDHFRRAAEIDPGFAEARNNLGVMLQSEGQLDEAIRLYRQALDLKPNYAEAHNNLGVMLQARGRIDEAIAHFREAVRLEPAYALARDNLEAALLAREKR